MPSVSIPAAIGGIVSSVAGGITAGATALGIGATTAGIIGSVAAPALFGAALGAGTAAITGGNPLTGALTGGLTGGLGGAFGGAGGALTGLLGSETAANGLIGAASGAIGSGLTGKDPLMGAAYGGAGGIAMGALNSFGDNGASQMTLPNGESIVPPIPPTLDAAGNPVGPSTGGTASGSGDALSSLNPQSALAAKGAGSGSGSGGGSALSKLGLSNPSLLMGALSAASSLFNKPQQGGYATPGPASNAANLGPLFNAPLNQNFPGRTAAQPNVPNYYTYGQIPGGATYFQGNSLRNYGFAEGGALSGAANENADREFRDGSGNHRVNGPGTETSDSIPALLSNHEYVLDAQDMRRIGGGDPKRGADIMDRHRKMLDRGGGPLSQLARVA